MNRFKIFTLVTIIAPTFILADLESVGQAIATEAIQAATKIALNSKGKIVLNNVEINCKFDANRAIMLGSGCAEIRANDITAFNLRINSDVKIKESFISGSPVYIGK